MFKGFLVKIVLCFILFLILANISSTIADVRKSSKKHSSSNSERALLKILELDEDADDEKIIEILDIPGKRIFASSLVRYRKITSATPKLVQIVKDENLSVLEKIIATRALCDFGNAEWIPVLKPLVSDPNSNLWISCKIEIAGLLARMEDYSQFKIAADHINNDEDKWLRKRAIEALGYFGHKTNKVTDSAVDLLSTAAKSDQETGFRRSAIDSLERIAKKKPDVKSKVIDALKANINSSDKRFKTICRSKLNRYEKNKKP